MTSSLFGTLPSGESIEKFVLTNAAGASLEVITYGGIVTALRVPDRLGDLADVVLGFDNLKAYVAGHPYFGAIIGRIAGRVTGGLLKIEGQTHQLACTDGPNHLHGGKIGFDKRLWRANPVNRPDGADSLRLTYHSPDGEEGYPGNLDVAITYTLTANNEFIIESEATSDRVTPLSLANHSYFNLAGEGSGIIADHAVQIFADACVPADNDMTLTGQRQSVDGTPNDFRTARRLGDVLPRLFKSHGENYLLRPSVSAAPSVVARVIEPASGRALTVSTDDCCLQFYTGVSLDGTLTGKSGRNYPRHGALCLECQGYPDGVDHPDLGDILVRPGTPQRRTTIYAFSVV
ncbi:MAG: galactose mutarotase [Cephaloticoccus sp.]|nr:galactose mutarotase [Cephaloticoccus sp.]MCF7761338.1 galactose mutarotase [Cephaloticoccus sp.]